MSKLTKLLGLVMVSTLAACGGGGGGGGSPAASASNPITVVPALGGFSAGADVAFLKPDGTVIGSAKTTAAGSATVEIGSYTGAFITKVTGGPGVTYYNEASGGFDNFGADDVLLAVAPSVPTGGKIGVTPLTNAAAAMVVSNPSKPTVAGDAAAAISSANTSIQASTGINILAAPRPLSSPTDKIDSTDATAVVYGAYLASLAQALPAGTSLLANATALATDAKDSVGNLTASAALIRTASTNLASVIASNVSTAAQSTAAATAATVTAAVTSSQASTPLSANCALAISLGKTIYVGGTYTGASGGSSYGGTYVSGGVAYNPATCK